MSGLDIEAIRQRRDVFRDARARVLRSWEPSSDRTDEERQRADQAQRAAALDAALDVEALLDQIARERAALDEALATVRAQAAEIERLRGRIREILGERDEARRDLAEADHEVDRMRVEIKRMVAHVHEQSEHDRLQREVVVAELAACRGALADALQVIADLRGETL